MDFPASVWAARFSLRKAAGRKTPVQSSHTDAAFAPKLCITLAVHVKSWTGASRVEAWVPDVL